MSDNEKANPAHGSRKSRGTAVGLRAAALAGVVLSAGAWGIAAPAAAADTQPATSPAETVASGWPWPTGTTCCPEDAE